MQSLEPSDPRQLGAYRITARIGEGGQGVVYLGTGGDGARVAVKLFHAGLSGDLGTLSGDDMFAPAWSTTMPFGCGRTPARPGCRL